MTLTAFIIDTELEGPFVDSPDECCIPDCFNDAVTDDGVCEDCDLAIAGLAPPDHPLR